MTPHAVFRCSEGCPGELSLWDPVYACPTCGGLLEVSHDLGELSRRSPAAWRELFDSRLGRAPWPLGGGVWGKREWVLPELEDRDIVSLGEGLTPLIPAPRAGAALGLERLWVKQCGTSHSGSFKDLGMTVLVSAVQRMRRLGKGPRAVACASTGDTSAALAAYCAAAGLPCAVLLPRGLISEAQLVQPLAHGARLLALDSDFDGCMKVVRELAADGTIYLANSMNSLRIEGQKTVAFEIVQQLGWSAPDWIFLPGGNLGNSAALGRGFELLLALGLIDRLPRLGVVQAAAAAPLHASYLDGFRSFAPVTAGETAATAIRIGNPVSAQKALRALRRARGIVESVTEPELTAAAALADRAGLYVCPQTAVALAGLGRAVASGIVGPSERVVVLATAHGLKFTEFKRETQLRGSGAIEIAATAEAARRALA